MLSNFTAWIALWSVLAAVTIALVVLFRTRWHEVRPWKKCAVLSLWVHVLLACAAMTVRIVSGAPGSGPEEPIRVAIAIECPNQSSELPDETLKPPLACEESTDPPLVAPPETPLPEPIEESEEAPLVEQVFESPDPPTENELFEAPALLAPPQTLPEKLLAAEDPIPVDEPAESEQNQQQESVAEPLPEVVAERQPNAHEKRSEVAQNSRPVRPLPSQYRNRSGAHRQQALARSGGNEASERAVRSALAWLAGAQSEHGGWDASRHGAGVEQVVLGHNRQGAGGRGDTGVSGLALLAFLGSGHTHQQGPYADRIEKGLIYLRRQQAADGALYGDAKIFARTYCHAMATFALSEALVMTDDPELRPAASRAVGYTLAAQHPVDGGWRYRPGDAGDTSQLGWQLMALKSAELAGIDIPETTWTRIERFLRRVRRGPSGGLAAYTPFSRPSRTMTAEAYFCRQSIAARYNSLVAREAAHEATQSLMRSLPGRGTQNLYFWYYATLALHHAQAAVELPDDHPHRQAWIEWNKALVAELLTSQNDDGSWSADTVWGGYGGRVYTTAMAALCLEVYYRYAPAEPTEIARGWRAGGRR